MTPAAKSTCNSPVTYQRSLKTLFSAELFDENSWSNHVMLGRWADLMLVAPLSCANSLARMANGICDNLLLATYLSATCPVVVAPAMDEDMWHHPSTIHNLEKISAYGNHIVPVGTGELASGLNRRRRRMAEPAEINCFLFLNILFHAKKITGEKKALVTAGPTHEAIDLVRYVSNHSSGKMGVALAEELATRGADVQLVMGPSSVRVHMPGVTVARRIAISRGNVRELYGDFSGFRSGTRES